MIKGRKKVDLSIETILSRITAYDIFRYYMPNKNWKVNHVTNSPFRKDVHPSFMIGNRIGNLWFIDFSDDTVKGDCFSFVRKLYNLRSLDETLKMIDSDFNLGILKGKLTNDYKVITEKYEQPEKKGKRYSLIQASTRAFTNEELAYWNTFYQDISDLKAEHVYSIDKLYLNKKLFSLNPLEMRFGYFYDGHWKIYRPFKERKFKWLPNNVPIDAMDGKKNIIGAKNAFINKSKKDYMVVKKVYEQTCAVQYEGHACFTPENVQFLKDNSERQTLSFDSDVAGVKQSQQITKLHDFDYCNVPKQYLAQHINDWAGLAKKYDLELVEKYLTIKGIIT